jgi:hypothetical protein
MCACIHEIVFKFVCEHYLKDRGAMFREGAADGWARDSDLQEVVGVARN